MPKADSKSNRRMHHEKTKHYRALTVRNRKTCRGVEELSEKTWPTVSTSTIRPSRGIASKSAQKMMVQSLVHVAVMSRMIENPAYVQANRPISFLRRVFVSG